MAWLLVSRFRCMGEDVTLPVLRDVSGCCWTTGLDEASSKPSPSSSLLSLDCRRRLGRSPDSPFKGRFFPDDPLSATLFGCVINGELCKPFALTPTFGFPSS